MEVVIEVEKILDELTLKEKEFILNHLIWKLKSEKNEERKEKPVQKGD
jgi:hypothetical protein